jgi:hypothetical protein
LIGHAVLLCVLNQHPGDTRHIRWAPCEDVSIVPEETGERDFLFGVEVGPDDDFLACVGQAEANFLNGWTWVQAVLVRFCSGTSRVGWSILAAWATMNITTTLIVESLESSTVAFVVVGDHDISGDRENSIWSWHLHDEVGVMRYGHELGEHRSPEDGMV